MGIVFRAARSADAARLVGLVEELGYPAPPERVAERLTHLLRHADQAVFVAEEEDELLGWIHVQESLSLASDPIGLITGLVIDPVARRRGLGRALVRQAEEWARARGLGALRLRARAARKGAHAFYRRLGFELARKQLQFRKEL